MTDIAILEVLAEELMKKQPDENLVKSYMEEAEMDYEKDPIKRINMVLRALHFSPEEENSTASHEKSTLNDK